MLAQLQSVFLKGTLCVLNHLNEHEPHINFFNYKTDFGSFNA